VVVDATKQLDQLASRLENVMTSEARNLVVMAPARDEVSGRVASTLNDVHTTFAKTADQGGTEIREIAATLRAHNDHIVAAEEDFTL
jgi:hypothetical protein